MKEYFKYFFFNLVLAMALTLWLISTSIDHLKKRIWN